MKGNKPYIYTLLALFTLMLGCNALCAQDGIELNEKEWQKRSEGVDYGDIVHKEKKEKDNSEVNDFNFTPPKEMGPVARAIVFGLLILLLLFILYKIFGSMAFGSKVNKDGKRHFLMDEVEDNLEEADLGYYLNKSLDKSDYRRAIRLYYLSIIKELSQREWINWKKDKTNYSYVSEMRKRNEHSEFRDLTRAYEIVWYGEGHIEEKHFNLLSPLFESFIDQLEKEESE